MTKLLTAQNRHISISIRKTVLSVKMWTAKMFSDSGHDFLAFLSEFVQKRHAFIFFKLVFFVLLALISDTSCYIAEHKCLFLRGIFWLETLDSYNCVITHFHCLTHGLITSTSHKRYGVSNQQQLDCLIDRLFKLTLNKRSKLCFTSWPFGVGTTSHHWNSLTND